MKFRTEQNTLKLQEERLVRINELAHIQKERELTKEEKEEQAQLRQAYLKTFREGFRQKLENTVIVDEMGNRRPLRKKGVEIEENKE